MIVGSDVTAPNQLSMTTVAYHDTYFKGKEIWNLEIVNFFHHITNEAGSLLNGMIKRRIGNNTMRAKSKKIRKKFHDAKLESKCLLL